MPQEHKGQINREAMVFVWYWSIGFRFRLQVESKERRYWVKLPNKLKIMDGLEEMLNFNKTYI